MFRISACYGEPDDRVSFDDHYTHTHVPLALKIPGLITFTTGKCTALQPGQDPPYYMVASLSFANAEDLHRALASPQMADAVADVPNFATGGLTLYSSEEIDRSSSL